MDEFKPERFLSDKGTLKDGPPMSANPIFGLGRRICENTPLRPWFMLSPTCLSGPGRFASEAFVWTAIVSILATFCITKANDANGKVIDVKRRFTTGLSVYVLIVNANRGKLNGDTLESRRPVAFPCRFISRSNERVQTIRECV